MSIAVSLNIHNRHVYIVGGGKVALRKAIQFMQEGAYVHVIGKVIREEFHSYNLIQCTQQTFSWKLVQEPCFFMYVATDDLAFNHTIVEEANQKNILCGCATFDENCGFYSMFEEKKTNIQLAFSTKGKCPGVDRSFLKELDPCLQQMNQRIEILQQLRNTCIHSKKETMKVLAKLSIDNLLMIQHAFQNHRPVLLLAYHGLQDVFSFQDIVSKFHLRIQQKFSSYDILYGFLSIDMIEKANKYGCSMNAMQDIVHALQMLHISYSVQPILLYKGVWYHRLSKEVSIGESLLERKEDVQQLYSIVKKGKKQPILFVHHEVQQNPFQHLQVHGKDKFITVSEVSKFLDETYQVIPVFLFISQHVRRKIKQQISSSFSFYDINLLENVEIQNMFIEKIENFLENA